MFRRRGVFVCCMVGWAVGCAATMTIDTQHEADIDFSKYHTWNWLPAKGNQPIDPGVADPDVQARIPKAIESEFLSRGFRQTPDSADCFVVYHAALAEHLSETTVDDRYDNASYAEYSRDWEHGYTHEWQEGSLVIDILDSQTAKLVWRGSAQAEITLDATDEEKDERVNEAVRKMLKKFPPK